MIWRSTLTILLLALASCSQQPPGDHIPESANLPFERWYVGMFAPDYMEVWVEQIDVTDRQGFTYYNVHGGVPAINTPPTTTKEIRRGGLTESVQGRPCR
ncbi:hypothetical protein ULG90_20060 [Halopseudomonas pachastrellae]|nr:hypothetical protein ULG90_20060 [Halopseudomonas pachastrellae]